MPLGAPTTSRRFRKTPAPAMRFDQRLVLNQWIFGLFEADSFIPLTDGLHDTALAGVDEINFSRYRYLQRATTHRRIRNEVSRPNVVPMRRCVSSTEVTIILNPSE